ncbi:MAG TPA: sigma-70 family RNA polymerase sigma factor [Phototrophicaceae bacterium]|jgi:RNA polymerase sigma-70 factor (ECF subfamily)|nr:sigma-70 family RNA polymerase sigma factor [Phototrophicaceae bacterium]
MSDTISELNRIILQARQGKREAIAQLYQMHTQKIYRYIAYRVTNDADAEDITAEVFVKMVEGLHTYQITGAPFEAWLYRIASARIIDFRRRGKHRQHDEISETMSDDDSTPEEYLLEHQEVETLRQALNQLSDEQQGILVLRFIERKSHQEVADILGKSITAVKSIQHRALTQLARNLGSEAKVRHYLRGEQQDG